MSKELTRWTKNGTHKSTAPRHDDLGDGREHANVEEKHAVESVAHLIVDNKKTHTLYQPKEHILTPKFNQLYDSLASTSGWRYCSDGYAIGQVTTAAGATVVSKVQLTLNRQWNTSRWPGGVQVYPVIRFFSMAPETVPATVGNISVLYSDQSGIVVPLGVFLSNQGYVNSNDTIIPSPITDTGNVNLGSIQVLLQGTTPTTAVYDWQISVSAAYLLPARKGYAVEVYDHTKEEYNLYDKQGA